MAIFRFLRATLCFAPRHTLIPLFTAVLLLAVSRQSAFMQLQFMASLLTQPASSDVTGCASVALISNGQVVGSAASVADGTFTITTGASGHFFLMVSANNFRQLQTPDFYAGQFDAIERNLVLEPAWVRESIVVTATGTPIAQQQTSSTITVLSPIDLSLRTDFISALRLMPGTPDRAGRANGIRRPRSLCAAATLTTTKF